MAVLLLNIHDVFIQRIGAPNVGGRDPVQDHVHDGNDIGQRLLFLPVEGLGLQRVEVGGGDIRRQHLPVSLHQEPRRPAGPVINGFADLWVNHLEHRANERARRVIFAPVAPRIAHPLDAALIEIGQLVLGLLGVELELIHNFQHVAQRIARPELVGDLREDFADLIFDGVRAGRVVAVFL